MTNLNKELIHIFIRMTLIDLNAKYKGSVLGFMWSFITPLTMLAAYTLVFSFILGAKWPHTEGSHLDFAINIFSGLILHGFIAEIMNRAPALIPQNSNYVKRMIFPLEILPGITTATALVNMLITLTIFLIFLAIMTDLVKPTLLALPIIIIPVLFIGLGLAFLLSALGCYLRDIQQLAPSISALLLFLSPIFYPLTAIQEPWRSVLAAINPLALPIEHVRDIIMHDTLPHWNHLSVSIILSAIFFMLSMLTYRKLKKGFSDVL